MGYLERSLGTGEEVVARAHFHWFYSLKAWLALILLFWCLVGIIIFVRMMVRQATTEIAVTSHRFVSKTGFIAIQTNEISLQNIEGVKLSQSFWGRILGYGHLLIQGTGVDVVVLPDIADPIEFRRALESAREANKVR